MSWTNSDRCNTPAGVTAISRGSSEATPPVSEREGNCTPEGWRSPSRAKWLAISLSLRLRPLRGRIENRGLRNRGYRCAEPPANGCNPVGVDQAIGDARHAAVQAVRKAT